MPIETKCPDCGRQYNVDDSLAGTRLQCLECGGFINLPGTPPAPKICIVCAKDLSSIERTRDPQGNYYCQPCWQAMVSAYRMIPSEIREEKLAATVAASTLHVPPPPRARKSELARVMASAGRFRLPWPIKLLFFLTIVSLLVATWWHPQISVIAASILGIPALVLVLFAIYWSYLLPFRDGWSVGRRYWQDKSFRIEWWQYNRDYPLRRPLLTIWTGIALIVAAAGFIFIAEMGERHRAEVEARGK